MMCRLFGNMMDVYLEGRLAGPEARRLERHAASCPACAAELKAWRRLFLALRSVEVPPLPEEKLSVMLQAAGLEAKYMDPSPVGDTVGQSAMLRDYAAVFGYGMLLLLVLSLSVSYASVKASDESADLAYKLEK